QLEAVARQAHRVDLERHGAGPDQPLQPIRLAADRAPAAAGHAGVQAAVRPEHQAVDAALEAAAEGEPRPLVAAVDLLQVDPHDRRLGLVADETLASERAEFTPGRIPDGLAGRLAHAAVGEPDARRRHGRHSGDAVLAALAVVEHAA